VLLWSCRSLSTSRLVTSEKVNYISYACGGHQVDVCLYLKDHYSGFIGMLPVAIMFCKKVFGSASPTFSLLHRVPNEEGGMVWQLE